MSKTARPRHLEAYPSFNILEATRAMKRGMPICQYRDAHWILGQLAVLELRPNGVSVASQFRFSHVPRDERTSFFQIQTAPMGNEYDRPFVRCPRCSSRGLVLWLVGYWACGQCQKLLHRSQLISAQARKEERRRKLRERVDGGRPKGMHNATFQALKDKLAALDHELEGLPEACVNEEHSIVLTRKWVPAKPDYPLWLPSYEIRDGQVRAKVSSDRWIVPLDDPMDLL